MRRLGAVEYRLTFQPQRDQFVGLLLEMCGSLNSGYMRALEPRTSRNTTPTSYENFVAESFVPAYQQQSAA